MELTSEKTTAQTRKTTQFIIPKPDMTRLKVYATKLPDGSRSDIKKRYGNILELLEVNVQAEAITAMAQYYDSPLRCFTFSNFQLAPTLEEFSLIIGQPLNDGKPYHFYGNYPRVNTVAKALRVNPDDINNKKANKETPEGIPRARMEELMNKLVGKEDWGILTDVLALAIYDLVLFPSSGDFVGRGAIDVFMARKCRKENSTFPILADVYYTLSLCHEEKGKKILCCMPILFIWLTAHIIQRNFSTVCPIAEWRKLGTQIYSARDWRQKFIELTEDTVRWYPLAGGVKHIILQCGDFPNVPLVGTSGCINYNPILALRQLRYPIMGPPTTETTPPFRTGLTDRVMLNKISKAWQNVTYKGGKELGNKSCGAKATYKEWVRNRVEVIKLPFPNPTPRPQQESDTVMKESDEVKVMEDKLARSEKEKNALEAELREIRSTLKVLKLEYEGKSQSLEQANKRARTEKSFKDKTKNHLSSVKQDLKARIAECDRVTGENEQLRRIVREAEQQVATLKARLEVQEVRHEEDRRFDEQTYSEIIKGYQEHLEGKHLEVHKLNTEREELLEESWQLKEEKMTLEAARAGAQQRLLDLDLKMREMIVHYEGEIKNHQLEASRVINIYRATLERKEEELRRLEHWSEERNHFLGLIEASRRTYIEAWYEVGYWTHKLRDIRRIPGLVRDADATINPLTTPREAIELINTCKRLVEDFEGLVVQAMKDVVVIDV